MVAPYDGQTGKARTGVSARTRINLAPLSEKAVYADKGGSAMTDPRNASMPDIPTLDIRTSLNPFLGRENNPFLHAMTMQARTFRAGLEMQMEAMDFVKHRYRHDIAFVEDVLAAREPADILPAWSEFLMQAAEDYTRETLRTANLGTRFASETAADLRHEINDLAEDARAAVAHQADAAA